MRNSLIISLALCSLLQLYGYGQSDYPECVMEFDTLLNRNIYTSADVMPTPKGGDANLFKKINERITQKSFSKSDVPGSLTIISFVVDEQGQIIAKNTIREDFQGSEIPKQMFLAIEEISWDSGQCNGKNIPVRVTLPLRICLE